MKEAFFWPPWCIRGAEITPALFEKVESSWHELIHGRTQPYLESCKPAETSPLVFFYSTFSSQCVSPPQLTFCEHFTTLFSDTFYDFVFVLAPEARALFVGGIQSQGRMFAHMLQFLVKNIHRRAQFEKMVSHLAVHHNRLGIHAQHYNLVGLALLYALRTCMGPALFDENTKLAWTLVYSRMCDVMMPIIVRKVLVDDLFTEAPSPNGMQDFRDRYVIAELEKEKLETPPPRPEEHMYSQAASTTPHEAEADNRPVTAGGRKRCSRRSVVIAPVCFLSPLPAETNPCNGASNASAAHPTERVELSLAAAITAATATATATATDEHAHALHTASAHVPVAPAQPPPARVRPPLSIALRTHANAANVSEASDSNPPSQNSPTSPCSPQEGRPQSKTIEPSARSVSLSSTPPTTSKDAGPAVPSDSASATLTAATAGPTNGPTNGPTTGPTTGPGMVGGDGSDVNQSVQLPNSPADCDHAYEKETPSPLGLDKCAGLGKSGKLPQSRPSAHKRTSASLRGLGFPFSNSTQHGECELGKTDPQAYWDSTVACSSNLRGGQPELSGQPEASCADADTHVDHENTNCAAVPPFASDAALVECLLDVASPRSSRSRQMHASRLTGSAGALFDRTRFSQVAAAELFQNLPEHIYTAQPARATSRSARFSKTQSQRGLE